MKSGHLALGFWKIQNTENHQALENKDMFHKSGVLIILTLTVISAAYVQ
jgi:hypothetical protein